MRNRVKAVVVDKRNDERLAKGHAIYNEWMSTANRQRPIVKRETETVFQTIGRRGFVFGVKI